MIDKNKIVFITVDWMKYYQGITENDMPLGTGGRYPKDQKHEVFNFLDDDGTCYGYTPPWGKIDLKRIYRNDIKKSLDKNEYIENVLVVFNASNYDGKNRRVVGFYVGATIFKEPYPNTNPKRIITSTGSFASYNIRVKSENVYLFENEKDRQIYLPYSKKDGYGYGQSNIWYANNNNVKCKEFRVNIVEQIETIIREYSFDFSNDEQKYFEGDIKTKVKEVSTAKRNILARKKCLEYYFPNDQNYSCILCGFNFKNAYGVYGETFIEVHHIESHTIKSKIKGRHEIDPIKDLIPVCSNCHSIIHREKPAMTIEKIKEIISSNKN